MNSLGYERCPVMVPVRGAEVGVTVARTDGATVAVAGAGEVEMLQASVEARIANTENKTRERDFIGYSFELYLRIWRVAGLDGIQTDPVGDVAVGSLVGFHRDDGFAPARVARGIIRHHLIFSFRQELIGGVIR
jgi:hypothetical protein